MIMKDQSQMMSRSQVIINQPSHVRVMTQPSPQLVNQRSQLMSQSQLMNQSQAQGMGQSKNMNQSQAQGMGQSKMMNQSQAQGIGMGHSNMTNRSYGMWPPPPQTSLDMMTFPNPMMQKGFVAPNSRCWKGKKGKDRRKEVRRKEKLVIGGSSSNARAVSGAGAGGALGGGGSYKPPTLNELQHQNLMKTRRFYPKKQCNRFAPYAPRNTTSFIIRAKKSGGIASLVSPYPLTPAVLPTPNFSPSREDLGDMVKEEWGVDGYGSMKGLIRLRSPANEVDAHEDDDDEEVGSSDSDVEEHVEVERRLDHDLSRFEMIYPNYSVDYNNVLENRVDDQDTHIAQLEEENLILKERLFLMEEEFADLRRRLQCLETQNQVAEEVNEEVVDNVSENEGEEREFAHSKEGHNEVIEENDEDGEIDAEEQHNAEAPETEGVNDVCMQEFVLAQNEVINNNESKNEGPENGCLGSSIGGNDGVCTEGFSQAQQEMIVEDQSKDGGVDGCSEISINKGDISNCPVSMYAFLG